jgi:integrase/recombinase XerD
MNNQKTQSQYMIRLKFFGLQTWIDAFIRDCKSRDLSPHTVTFYAAQLAAFVAFCTSHDVSEVESITADMIRAYLLQLEATGHNPGGRHAKFRALRAFLLWYEREAEPEGWKNPIVKVRAPKVAEQPITGVSLADVKALLDTCGSDFIGNRDRAIILCLLDTGARVGEFISLNLDDLDPIGGGILLRKTKGKRPRMVFIGKKSRRALRAYLKQRTDESAALWVTRAGDRLAVHSLQSMLQRRAKMAGLKDAPSPHDFRRAMALIMLRAGTDVFSLQKLLGHVGLEVLNRYLAQTDDDLKAAHDRGGPVDKMF